MAVDQNEKYLITGEQLEDLGSRIVSATAPIDSDRIDTTSLAVYEKIYTYTVPTNTTQSQEMVIPVDFEDYDKIIFDFVGTATANSGWCALWTTATGPGSPHQETYQIGFEWNGNSTISNTFRSRSEIGAIYYDGTGDGIVSGGINATFTIPDATGYAMFVTEAISGPNGGLYAQRFSGRMKSDQVQNMHYIHFELPAVAAGGEIRVYGIPKPSA